MRFILLCQTMCPIATLASLEGARRVNRFMAFSALPFQANMRIMAYYAEPAENMANIAVFLAGGFVLVKICCIVSKISDFFIEVALECPYHLP